MNKKQKYLATGWIAGVFATIIIALISIGPIYRAEIVSFSVMQQLSDGRLIGTEKKGDDIERYVLQDIAGDQKYITAEEYEDLRRTVGINYRGIEQPKPDSEPDAVGNEGHRRPD
jgi:hypothetical protein